MTAKPVQILPVDHHQQAEVVAETQRYIALAGRLFGRTFAEIDVSFDLKGRAAGMYVVSRRGWRVSRKIRYNPWLFAKYYRENMAETVPHEVAHYVVDCLYGGEVRRDLGRAVCPHGVEWQAVMAAFGVEPRVRASFDLTGIPVRKQATVAYRCDCRQHQLGIRRHNKVLRGTAQYLCRACGNRLQPQ